MTGCVHIIGAGLSGLSAAVELANNDIPVIIHEGAGHAGGRCRSYFDTELDRMIDNGNHLVLSGNHATLNYLRLVGSFDTVKIVKPAEVNFLDLANNDCWVVRPDKGRIPWSWIRQGGRVPGSSLIDYLKCWRLMWATEDQTISDVLPTEGDLWKKFWVPFIVSITNTDAEGRLILADTLTYATEKNTDILVTFASLTGAARVAMGTDITPFFSTNDHFADLLKKCGDKMLDPVWQLPFYEDYNKELSSNTTDLNNAPLGGMAGAITAALFLKKFTKNHNMFLHFDIYGWNSKPRPAKTYGGLMQGVRSLGLAIEKKIQLYIKNRVQL